MFKKIWKTSHSLSLDLQVSSGFALSWQDRMEVAREFVTINLFSDNKDTAIKKFKPSSGLQNKVIAVILGENKLVFGLPVRQQKKVSVGRQNKNDTISFLGSFF